VPPIALVKARVGSVAQVIPPQAVAAQQVAVAIA
jgi:hypothetical protein